jgi:four helix bundle protein
MDLVVGIYKVTRRFPPEELYALTSQLRRAAVSIPSNIAEGQGRGGTADFLRFLGIATGSLQEAETQLFIAERLGYVNRSELSDVFDLIAETGRLISGLVRSLS